jgi:hypothetical protein
MNPNSENIAYHAARLLILIRFCGKPRSDPALYPGVEGRTLLAKLDFFLRYPVYLKRAALILNNEDVNSISSDEINTVESRMIRYLYGPWDRVYYEVLAYLIGKGLIVVNKKGNTEIFQLSVIGMKKSEEIALESSYADLVSRAGFVNRLFSKYSGNRLKEFIYQYFPDVVNKDIGEVI